MIIWIILILTAWFVPRYDHTLHDYGLCMYVCSYVCAVWYCLDDQRPESRDLSKFLTEYCKHWRDTGLQLGLQSSVLDQVEADYHTQRECFRVTLDKWLQLNVGVTWGSLELAITNANRASLSLQPLTISKEYSVALIIFIHNWEDFINYNELA